MRLDGRSSSQIRPLRLIPHYFKNPLGCVLVEAGETRVLCSVSVEENVPNWMRNSKPSRGWLTAEYSMLPASTHTRGKRERSHISGRSQEIQRLIGRSLRGVMDLNKCPDLTFLIDCDVLQADGGTRTASITGAYVALKLAVDKLLRAGKLKQNPIIDGVAALSIGMRDGQVLLDLDYSEDSTADIDANVVMTHSRRILEVQGTGEKQAFSKEQLIAMLDAAEASLASVFDLQQIAGDGQLAEM